MKTTNLTWTLAVLCAAGMAAFAPPAHGQGQTQAPAPIPTDPAARKDFAARLLATAARPDAPLHERFAACRGLAVLGDDAAVPVLAGLLGDEKLSHMARYALEPNPSPAVDDAFRAALGRVKGPQLLGIIDSIGIRRDPQAVPALAALLGSPDPAPALVAAAAASLGRIGTPEAAAALEKATAGAAAGAAPAAIADGCLRAADALCAKGRTGAALAIYDRLRSGNAPRHVRMAALHGALLARGSAGVALLIEQIAGADAGMAAVALRATYEMGGADLTRALTAALPKLPAARQIPLLQALAERKDAAAAEAVTSAAKSGPVEVRVAAIRAACQIGSPASLPALVELCLSPDAAVAAAAQAGLAGFAGKDAEAAVTQMLGSPDASARRVAVDLAGQRRVSSALPALLKAAGDADPQVARASCKVLGELATAAELPALLNRFLAGPQRGDVENALAAVCARLGEAACVDALRGAMAMAQTPVPARQGLLRVLRSAGGPKALETVRAAMSDPNPEIADTATRLVCDWPAAEAAAQQLALAKTSGHPTYRVLALRGYIRSISDPGLTAAQRQDMCREAAALIQRDDEKKLLLGALGSAGGDARSLAMVMTHLASPATAEEASAAAVAIAERLVTADPATSAESMKAVLKSTQNADVLKRARRVLAQTRPNPPAK